MSTTPDCELPVSVRLNRTVKAEICKIAERDCNSLSGTIRKLLTRAIALERRAADDIHTRGEGA